MAFRATARRGRPPVGQGADRVLVSIECGLLQQADSLAKRRKVNRSQLIADALRRELSRERTPSGPRAKAG
jgi:metal-responsive CopG/Arc/MetJ family transcriptional regulator